jgi:hypothetical protein
LHTNVFSTDTSHLSAYLPSYQVVDGNADDDRRSARLMLSSGDCSFASLERQVREATTALPVFIDEPELHLSAAQTKRLMTVLGNTYEFVRRPD